MPKIFTVDAQKDFVTIDLSAIDQKTQLQVSELLEAELPPSTERKCVGSIVTLKLSALKNSPAYLSRTAKIFCKSSSRRSIADENFSLQFGNRLAIIN